MKFFKLLLSALLLTSTLFVFSSCGDDEENNDATECSNAVASGSIDGKSFNFQAGTASDVSDGVSFRMYSDDVTFTDVCTFSSNFGDDAVNLFGTLPSATVGRTALFLSPDFTDGYTITLFDAEDFNNIIATEGFIEVTEVTDTTISGFLKADAGGGDIVCGTFVLTRC